jgi:hypothetical protein
MKRLLRATSMMVKTGENEDRQPPYQHGTAAPDFQD